MGKIIVPRLPTLKSGSEFELRYDYADGNSVVSAHDAIRRIRWRWVPQGVKLEITQVESPTGGAYLVKVLENPVYRDPYYTVSRKKTKAESSARLLPHENGGPKFWAGVYLTAYMQANRNTNPLSPKPHEYAAHEADTAHREYVKRFGP